MKHTFLLLCLLISCQGLFGQEKARYTQSSEEIETIKALVNAYNTGAWEKFDDHYAPDGMVNHNTASVSPAMLTANFRSTAEACSYYRFELEAEALERTITDKGETWVNSWGEWQGIPKGGTDTVTVPIHVTYRFNKAGKIDLEYGYYDFSTFTKAVAEASYGKDFLLYIREDKVKEGKEAAYTDLVKAYKAPLDEKKVPVSYWTSSSLEDGTVYHQQPINSLNDLEGMLEEERQADAAIGDKMEKISQTFLNTVEGRRDFIVRRNTALSYWPAGDKGLKNSEIQYFNMIFLKFDPVNFAEHLKIVQELNKVIEGLDAEHPLPYNYFTYEFGGGGITEAVVVEYAKSKADYEMRKAEEHKLIGKERLAALEKRMGAIYTGYKEVGGIVRPDLSRVKPAKK